MAAGSTHEPSFSGWRIVWAVALARALGPVGVFTTPSPEGFGAPRSAVNRPGPSPAFRMMAFGLFRGPVFDRGSIRLVPLAGGETLPSEDLHLHTEDLFETNPMHAETGWRSLSRQLAQMLFAHRATA
jgi:hypothetical protein